jgi:hypothetical protein
MYNKAAYTKKRKKLQEPAKSVGELIERVIRIVKAKVRRPGKISVTLGAQLDGVQTPMAIGSHPKIRPILRFDEFDVQHLEDETPKGKGYYVSIERRRGFRTRLGAVPRVGTEFGASVMPKPKIRMRTKL